MPKAKPFHTKPRPPEVLEEIFMRDLERFFPETDGRKLRGLAKRLSRTDADKHRKMIEDELANESRGRGENL